MIKKIFSDELFKGSLTLLILFGLFNFFHVIYHFVGARLLGAENYGILATVFGIAFILGIPSEAIQTIISRYTTKFRLEKGKIKDLLKKSFKKFSLIFLISIIVFMTLSPFIGGFLSIDYKIILLVSFFLMGTYFIPINRGILQGEKKFFKLGVSMISESFTKVVFLVVFVLIGFGVYGAVGAIIMGFLVSFLISFNFIKDILRSRREKNSLKGIYSYSWLVLIATGCIILFYSLDIILAKRFFSAQDVGLYAAITILGKSIFWATAPISKAMFPLVSEKRDKEKSYRYLVRRSLIMVISLCLVGIIIFGVFPKIIIKIFYGSAYLKFSNLLLPFGVAMTLLSITNIFVYNSISYKRKISLILIPFIIFQIILLSLFHSTVAEFINMLIISNLIMALFFVIDYIVKK